MVELVYDLIVPVRVVFGWGRRRDVGQLARTLGRRAFLVRGSRTLEQNGTLSEIAEWLRATGVEPISLAAIHREPLVEDVDQAVAALRGQGAGPGDLMIAVGGGSAIDLAKAAGAIVTQRQAAGSVPDARSGRDTSVADYLEGVGRGLQIVELPLPMVAMPTTAGTGTEATKNAVISSNGPPFKKSLRSEQMVPKIVLIDPELSVSVPPNVTAHTGMDAITQLIESFVCKKSQPIPQTLALHGLELAVPAIVEAVRDGTSRPARERMSHAAFLSGVALANSGLGMAHGVAAALGVHCQVPHGLACAVMLPAAMRANLATKRAEFAQIGTVITGQVHRNTDAAAEAAVEKIEELLATVNIPRKLSAIGVRADQLDDLVCGSRGNSMNGNPRELSDGELHDILEAML